MGKFTYIQIVGSYTQRGKVSPCFSAAHFKDLSSYKKLKVLSIGDKTSLQYFYHHQTASLSATAYELFLSFLVRFS